MNSTTLRKRLERLYSLHADLLMERRPVRGERFASAARIYRRIHRLGNMLDKRRREETLQAIAPAR